MEQLLPNDIMIEIGKMAWRVYKAMIVVNRSINKALSAYSPAKLFYREVHNGMYYTERKEYYKYVIKSSDFIIQIYINGIQSCEYELSARAYGCAFKDYFTICHKRRYKRIGSVKYTELTIVMRKELNGGYNLRIMRCLEEDDYKEQQRVNFTSVKDGNCVKWVPVVDESGKVPPGWRITLPGFFNYDF
ncbi:hypothetical protein E24_00512 [Faustovirus]|nr:hypothetical protein PRJ_Fausto_00480 [Faustovirus]AMN83425.1 hypothetical protein E24_00512 [Faustovirus]AMN85396.1 hypothetical protein E23_00513 [Faustovirus]QBR98936.1 hypothetical protein [Faustovirus mariensis]